MVFRVGASGANLGANSAAFAADRSSRAGSASRSASCGSRSRSRTTTTPTPSRDAAEATAAARGLPVVLRRALQPRRCRTGPRVMADLAAARPDVIILASHIPDGIAFRQAMVAAGLRVGALIGSTMAECDPDFAGELGADAIGIFASDRPTAGFQPSALRPEAADAYARFAAAWAEVASRRRVGDAATRPAAYGEGGEYGDAEYTIHGPDEDATAEESEEALAGFTAAWALFRHVLPASTGGGEPRRRRRSPPRRGRSTCPDGSLPNGAGLRFSSDAGSARPERARRRGDVAVEAERTYEFVWPPDLRDGRRSRSCRSIDDRRATVGSLALPAVRGPAVRSRRGLAPVAAPRRRWRRSSAARWCGDPAGLDPLPSARPSGSRSSALAVAVAHRHAARRARSASIAPDAPRPLAIGAGGWGSCWSRSPSRARRSRAPRSSRASAARPRRSCPGPRSRSSSPAAEEALLRGGLFDRHPPRRRAVASRSRSRRRLRARCTSRSTAGTSSRSTSPSGSRFAGLRLADARRSSRRPRRTPSRTSRRGGSSAGSALGSAPRRRRRPDPTRRPARPSCPGRTA